MSEPGDDRQGLTRDEVIVKKRNAFSELMASKPKAFKAASKYQTTSRKSHDPCGALLDYILHPDRHSDSVLQVTDHTVLIRDKYPKATVHLLLLPRSSAHYDLHPHEAFADPAFLSMMRVEVASAVDLAAAELGRRLAASSSSCAARNAALDAGVPFDELPPGRDWRAELRVGIHAHPSMRHLHVHILSPDMHSDCVKHRKHYNSFNTPFFIPLQDYPLAEADVRRQTAFQNGNMRKEFVCWRCGQTCGNRFTDLKEHLSAEFEGWKKE